MNTSYETKLKDTSAASKFNMAAFRKPMLNSTLHEIFVEFLKQFQHNPADPDHRLTAEFGEQIERIQRLGELLRRSDEEQEEDDSGTSYMLHDFAEEGLSVDCDEAEKLQLRLAAIRAKHGLSI